MSDDTRSISGQCLCGAVTFNAGAAQPHLAACHCAMCRRWGGGGPLMAVNCGTDVRFENAIGDSDNIGVYRSSDWAERGFCKSCGTSLFYRLVEPGVYYVPVGLLQDQSDEDLSLQIFIDEKPAFYDLAGDIPAMTGEEIFAEFASEDG
jgi:hypothetical protein